MSRFKKTLGGISPNAEEESVIPPPRSEDDLRPGRAPRGSRTPSLGQDFPELDDLPPDATPWMKRARRLVLALEHAIAGGHVQPSERAALERAWSAYELGVSDAVIAKVAHLCERAHGAINQRFRGSAREAVASCAAVLHSGLPRNIRRQVSKDEVTALVRGMRSSEDRWGAVVDATSKILRWDTQARGHAGQAVRVALDSHVDSTR